MVAPASAPGQPATAARRVAGSALLALAAAALAVAPARATADTERAFAPWGILVTVAEGRRLHLHCQGEGLPVVLLEAGLGGNHLDWVTVQPLLVARGTRVCSYDRAGYGWSDPGPKPRSVAAVSDDLAALVAAADLPVPLVLAGHSFGGLVALRHAAVHPGQVAGLVLVDSMHPDQFDRFAAAGVDVPTEPTRGVIAAGADVLARGIPPEHRALALRLAEPDRVRSAMFSELRTVLASIAVLRALPPPAARVPARVLAHGNREWDRIYPDGRMEIVWAGLQADLATRLGAPPPQISPTAGHLLPLEDPGFVADAILALVATLRGGAAPPG